MLTSLIICKDINIFRFIKGVTVFYISKFHFSFKGPSLCPHFQGFIHSGNVTCHLTPLRLGLSYCSGLLSDGLTPWVFVPWVCSSSTLDIRDGDSLRNKRSLSSHFGLDWEQKSVRALAEAVLSCTSVSLCWSSPPFSLYCQPSSSCVFPHHTPMWF